MVPCAGNGMTLLTSSSSTVALLALLGLSCHTVSAGEEDALARCTDDAMLVFDASGSMAEMGYNAISSPRIFDARKVGHAGTLDPLATGILPIALGEATKTVS